MRRQSAPEQLFHEFRLQDHVPNDHPLRQIDAVLLPVMTLIPLVTRKTTISMLKWTSSPPSSVSYQD